VFIGVFISVFILISLFISIAVSEEKSNRINDIDVSRSERSFRLSDRLALREEEAAEALGISVRKLRDMLPRLPHVRDGGTVMIPVDSLRDWLREQARAGGDRIDATVQEIMDSFDCEEDG